MPNQNKKPPSSGRKQADQDIQNRVRQLEAVAALGQLALASKEITSFMDQTVKTISQILGAAFCKILELQADGQGLRLRSGVGWKPGVVGNAVVGAERASQAGYTLLIKKPVIVEDLRTDTRFTGPSLLIDHGAISGLSVIISGQDCPYGVLGVHTKEKRRFTKDDIHFIQSVANILANAIECGRTHDRLREEKEFSENLINSSVDGILAFDRDCRYTIWNKGMERISGYGNEKVLGQCAFDVFPFLKETGEDRHFFMALEGRHTRSEDRPYNVPGSGRSGFFSGHYAPLYGNEGEVVGGLAVIRDMTERKKLEVELLQSRNLRSIGQLAGGFAHEFNNLLTPIIGHLECALEQSAQQPALQASLIPANKAAVRAAALTQELLAFGRQNPLQLRSQDLHAIAEEAVHLLRQTIDRRIVLNLVSPKGLWPVLMDAHQIHQVILNLCINARDALDEHLREQSPRPPFIRLTLTNVHLDDAASKIRSDAKTGDFVCLSVSDNGPGIPKADRPRLFEPFFTTKEVGRGTGLGLASSYGIVKNHNGWIGLADSNGEGSTFEVYLPRTQEPVVPKPRQRVYARETQGNETILVVDDDALIRELARTALEMRGYSVLTAESGDQAYTIFKQARGRIPLVVLDLSLPGQSGWEVLRHLRSLDPGLKVIISSGHDVSGPVEDLQDIGAVAILPKPYTPRALLQMIRDTLDHIRDPLDHN
ncbi:MAG: response regulator [Nitrospiria bacterium]